MNNPLLDLISRGESGAAGYDAYNRGMYKGDDGMQHFRGPDKPVDLSSLTVGQIQDLQHLDPKHPNRLFAVGKYQIIPSTMDAAVNKLNLDRNERFTPELQDKIFSDFLIVSKQSAVYDFIASKPEASIEAAQRGLAREWASFGDPDKGGKTHYKAPNRASITLEQSAAALNQMRTEYQANVAKGLSAEQAWSAATNMGPGQFEHIAKAQTAQPHTAINTLHEGAHNPAVGELQTQLNNLGYTDASGRPLEPDSHFGPATRVAVENFQRDHGLADDGAVGPATRAALGKATQAVASTNLDANTVRTLQNHLHTLGVTDMNQQAVTVTGVYDLSTRTAVARFQSEQGMPVTGRADEATRSLLQGQAFIADLQKIPVPTLSVAMPQREPQFDVPKEQVPYAPLSSHTSPAMPKSFLMFDDPNHPQHALYNTLKEGFPADTTPEWLAHATATCYKSGIKQPDDLGNVFGNGQTIRFECNSLFGQDAFMDITQPPPTLQQTMQGAQQFDQQQAQMMSEIHALNTQINAQAQQGPVSGGPPMR